MAPERLAVEVVCVVGARSWRVPLEVPRGTTVRNALERARLDEQVSLDWSRCRYGVFGVERALDALLEDGDRVEVYRPLLADPKTIRRRRAAAAKGN